MNISMKSYLKLKARIGKKLKQIEKKRYLEEDCLSFRTWFEDLMPRYLEDYKRFCKFADKKYVDEIIKLFKEGCVETCSKINKYDAKYKEAFKEYSKKYGFEKSIFEIPEYSDICAKWAIEETKISQYADRHFNKALDKLKRLT